MWCITRSTITLVSYNCVCNGLWERRGKSWTWKYWKVQKIQKRVKFIRNRNTKIKTVQQICIRVSFLLRRRVVDFPCAMETISQREQKKIHEDDFFFLFASDLNCLNYCRSKISIKKCEREFKEDIGQSIQTLVNRNGHERE